MTEPCMMDTMCWLFLVLSFIQTTSAIPPAEIDENCTIGTRTSSTGTTIITTTIIKTTTTSLPPVIGEQCTDYTSCNWTNSRCQNNICQCNNGFFQVNSTACIKVPFIQMTVLYENETAVMLNWSIFPSDSTEVQNLISNATIQLWVTVQELDENWLANCTINQSLSLATCAGLFPGAHYNLSVNLYHTMGYFRVQEYKIFLKRPSKPGPISQSEKHTAPNISLSWNASDGLVDIYSVIVRDSDEMIVANVTTDNNQSYILITGLRHGHNYTVQLLANRLNKTSEPRNDFFSTTIMPPYSPNNVTVQEMSMTNNSLSLTWIKPSDFNGPRVGYIVCILERIYPDETATNRSCNETSEEWFQVTFLTAGAFYMFSVYSHNSVYNSSIPAISKEKQTQEGRPGVVDKVELVPFEDKIDVMWHRPKQPYGNIIAYKINVSNMDNTSDCHLSWLITDEANIKVTKGSSNCTYQEQGTEVNKKELNVSITSLMPDSNYSIIVMAFTRVGAGMEYFNKTATFEIVPGHVTDVMGNASSATEIFVSWHSPLIRTGRTHYHIEVYDTIAGRLNQSINVTGYEVQNWTVTGLQEFWVYHFAVYTSTLKGASSPFYSANVTTLEASPRAAVDPRVMVHKNNSYCDATKVSLYWQEPKLEDRNGKIVQYNISLKSGNNVTRYTRPIEKPDPYSKISHTWSRTLDTKPEQQYTVQIWAITATGKEGEKEEISFKSIACKPPSYTGKADLITVPVMSTSSFTVKLYQDFFRNDEQGKVVSYGLVMSNENSADVELNMIPDTEHGKPLNFPYKINLSILQNEVLNQDLKFSLYSVENIPEDTTFYLSMYACTNSGCTVSNYYGPYRTLKLSGSSTSDTPVIVGAVCGALCLISLVIAGTIIIIKKMRMSRIPQDANKTEEPYMDLACRTNENPYLDYKAK